MTGTVFEADELYQNAGKNRRRGNQRKGHGTYANDRPPASA
jgi:hypothetical protein